MLFKSRCEDLDKECFLRYTFLEMYADLPVPLETFNEMVNEFISKDTINSFTFSPLYAAMRMWHESGPDIRDGWEKLVHRLLALGPDLHKRGTPGVTWPGSTVLHQVLSIAKYPFESGELGEQWLRILESFGIDIEKYLRSECAAWDDSSPLILDCPTLFPFHVAYDRCAYIIFSESSPRLSWDWYIDPESHAVEVLHEFKDLGPSSYDTRQDYQFPEAMVNWPYFYPGWVWVCYKSEFRYVLTEDEMNKMKSLSTLFEKRFERRRLKKAQKLYNAQGIGKCKRIPGAWID